MDEHGVLVSDSGHTPMVVRARGGQVGSLVLVYVPVLPCLVLLWIVVVSASFERTFEAPAFKPSLSRKRACRDCPCPAAMHCLPSSTPSLSVLRADCQCVHDVCLHSLLE